MRGYSTCRPTWYDAGSRGPPDCGGVEAQKLNTHGISLLTQTSLDLSTLIPDSRKAPCTLLVGPQSHSHSLDRLACALSPQALLLSLAFPVTALSTVPWVGFLIHGSVLLSQASPSPA